MSLIHKITFYTVFLLLVFSCGFAQAQQSTADSLKLERQRVIDSTKLEIKHRTDSLAAIREYRQSKQYKDSVQDFRQNRLDSIRTARTEFYDSVKTERRRVLDSAIASRKAFTDSIRAKQEIRTDSLAAIRKYRSSKHYKDSVTKGKQARIDSIRAVRTAYFDSVRTERRRVLDSAIASRKAITDSIRAKQKIRTDSLATIRKYKESRRYRDSVKVVRQSRLDSIRLVRKEFSDSVIAERKARLELLTQERKARMDSLTQVRKVRMDSLKTLRDLRADSLAKRKELREKELKANQKKKEEKLKMQFELKIKKKHEAWSNEKMLKKKWSFLRKGFQNTYTRYNYYFNSKRKMEEAKKNMERRNKDDFEQLINLFPFDPNVDSTVFASDMDTIIRKASVGIQIHDPRTKWADDLYLLMGQAYYYKGDYERATTAFKYVIGIENTFKNKKKKKKKNDDKQSIVKQEKSKLYRLFHHKPAHNDAILWLTRTDVSANKEKDAEAILDLMDASAKLSESMKAKIALERANLFLKNKDYRAASTELEIIAQSKAISKNTRQRASFLNGQLEYKMGEYNKAEQSFVQNIALHPAIDMDFYARKNRADAVAQGGGDQSKSISSLKSMLKDGKYAPYHEQIYFILGKLSSNDNHNEEALAFFQKSLEQSKTTKRQKAITFATMGNIQYKMGDYPLAKRSYDSASYFAKNLGNVAEIETAMRRGKSLDKIEIPYNTLQMQDSLLKLSNMSEKEQKNVAKKYLKYLEQLQDDSVANAQNAATSGSLGNSTNAASSNTGSWYFSSPVAVQQGYNEFKRKWGSRPLIDNWRRASASSFGANNTAELDTDANNTGDNEINESSLLAGIPKTDAQKLEVKKKLERAYVDLGQAYIKDIEEYKEGLTTLDSLDHRFSDHPYGDEVLFLKYTAALRQNKLEEAEAIRGQLLNKYPNSDFAKSLAPETSDIAQNIDTNKEDVATYYEATYNMANNHDYVSALQRSRAAQRMYGDINYSRKFRILEALSLASLGAYFKADTVLKDYIKEFPSDSLRPWVDAITKFISEQKAMDTLGKDSVDKHLNALLLGDTTLSSKVIDSSATTAIPKAYTYEPQTAHYCIYIMGTPDTKVAAFRSGLNDYSTIKFNESKLSAVLDMLNSKQSLIISKTFSNAKKAKEFMLASKNEKLLFRDIDAGSYQYFIISESNFLKLKADKKLEEYLSFYNKKYK